MNLNRLAGKKILILGLGREGTASLRFFLDNCPGCEIGLADATPYDLIGPEIKEIVEKHPEIKIFCGSHYLASMDEYDIVVKSPGIPIHIPEIEQAFNQGKITSQTEIFFEQAQGMLVGITGTKGKSTTSSITYSILKAAGRKVFLVGNIGTPMISYLEEDGKDSIFVCELSAHQLYDLKRSPHIAVLLNLYQEHLDYYKDFGEYIRSKANIAIHQTKDDYLIYNSGDEEVSLIAKESAARTIAFNEYDWKFGGNTDLIGDFNLENARIGAIIGRLLGVDDATINQAISNFKPLENRLELVGNFNGIDCYNDSLSTIQESAVAAITSLGERVQTLIAGGFERNQPFEKLADAILKSNIKTLVLFPTTGKRIWEEIRSRARESGQGARLGNLRPYFVDNMEDAVRTVFANTESGRICLLSAASASYNMFKDYADRGNQYKTCLTRLASVINDQRSS
ncbi:MAG: UDP-N-acetylmuramoyl-L-alanine--D-glutamate ligase [Candidatus Pacebacteria bacterium]|nr:UDP-N-acetylmuramoyl-L-alanine--D-glutamate ligase [Candidatus Paceibacterota bacterium]